MTGMTLEQATAQVCKTDPRFELSTAQVAGVEYTVFKNAPKSPYHSSAQSGQRG